jgi:hypothetical protein
MQTVEAKVNHPRFRPRAILTAEEAAEIYQYQRTKPIRFRFDPALTGNTSAVAKKYSVSPKAVRDIWNRRTWTTETHHLWSLEERPMIRANYLQKSRLGKSLIKARSSSIDSTITTNESEPPLYDRCMDTSEQTRNFFCSADQGCRTASIGWQPCSTAPQYFPSNADVGEGLSVEVNDHVEDFELPGCLEVTDDPFHADWPFW